MVLRHATADVKPQVFGWLQEALAHLQRTVRMQDALRKVGYTQCFTDEGLRRKGAMQMREDYVPEEEEPEDPAKHAELQDDADDQGQQQFYA